MSGIFVSYRREDTRPYARSLGDALVARFGADQVFRDVDSLAPGADFPDAIAEAVGKCEVLLALIGDKWLSAMRDGKRRLDDPLDYVRLEIAAALARDTVVVPVLIDDATMPRRDELPDDLAELADRNALRLTDAAWNEGLARLTDFLGKFVAPAGGLAGRADAATDRSSEGTASGGGSGDRHGGGKEVAAARPAHRRWRTIVIGVLAAVGALAVIGLLLPTDSEPPAPPAPAVDTTTAEVGALGGEITDVRLSGTQPCCTYAVQAHILGFRGQECTLVVSVIDRVSGQSGDPGFFPFAPEANDDRASQEIPVMFHQAGEFTLRFILLDPEGVELDREEIFESVGP